MVRSNLKRFLQVVFTLIITAMNLPVNSQSFPAFDNIPTSSGNIEIHFIGHGSLSSA